MANIAFDATANGAANANSLTIAHTCSGTQRVLFVGVGDITGGGTWHITGVTYNGVAMTEIGHTANAGGMVGGLFYLINPATGANNIVISSSTVDFLKGVSASYTGCGQVTQPDGSNTNVVDPGTTITTTCTTATLNDWAISFVADASGLAMTASTGVNATRGSNGTVVYIGDSNGIVAPGNQSHTWTCSSQSVAMVIAGIKSDTVAGKSNNYAFFM